MKAAVLHEVNKPLVIEDVSLTNPGPREVLIRTSVAGLCHSDHAACWSRQNRILALEQVGRGQPA